MGAIILRRATRADVKAFTAFARSEIMRSMHYNLVSRKAYSSRVTQAYIRRVRGGMGFALMAFDGKKLVGCMWACFDSYDKSIAEFEWTLVDRSHRGMGIARRMHIRAETLAKEMGARKVWGDSRASNYQAINLEKNLGIRTIGKLKSHWFGEDYIFWEHMLK